MFEKEYKVALKAIEESSKIVKEGFSLPLHIDMKGTFDPVTQFDKGSEQKIIEVIKKEFPDHSFLTEEGFGTQNSSDYKWIIDPIDGTVNFTHRIPLIQISIGLEYKGELVLGVLYNPAADELFTAIKGEGAFLNGKPIHVSHVDNRQKAIICCGFAYNRSEAIMRSLLDPFEKIAATFGGIRSFGACAINMGWLAAGRVEAYYQLTNKPWDMAASAVIACEAGAKITSIDGTPFDLYRGDMLVSNGYMHDELLDILKNIDPNMWKNNK